MIELDRAFFLWMLLGLNVASLAFFCWAELLPHLKLPKRRKAADDPIERLIRDVESLDQGLEPAEESVASSRLPHLDVFRRAWARNGDESPRTANRCRSAVVACGRILERFARRLGTFLDNQAATPRNRN